MDLPTCPSCGQSVLDDDAVDCPFCGSSMSAKPGKAAPKATAAQPPQKKTASKQVAADSAGDPDDPFGVSAPVMNKAIQLLPKPAKGKLHRILCPMCETPGFQSKKAAGREVRCANRDCLVPIFTAPPLEGEEAEEAPRVEVEEKKSGGPVLLYVGVTALMLVIGGVAWFLNRPPSTAGLDAPYVPPVVNNGGGEVTPDPGLDPSTGTAGTTKTEAEPPPQPPGPTPAELRTEALRLMSNVALIRDRNSRKPYCRRMTAEALALTGDLAGVETQLQQLDVVGPTLRFYGVSPLVEVAWQHLAAGRTAELNATIARIEKPLESLPEYGTIAVSTTVEFATLLAATDQTDKAISVLGKRRNVEELGQFVETWERWLAAPGLSFDATLAQRPVTGWSEPQWAAVAFGLSCRGKSDKALAWAQRAASDWVKTECLSAWAEGQVLAQGRAAVADVEKQLAGLSPADRAFVLARCELASARGAATGPATPLLQKAVEALAAAGTPGTVAMPNLKTQRQVTLPDSGPLTAAAVAAAEIAHAQLLRGNADAAWTSVTLAEDWARAMAPSPSQAQEPFKEIDRLGASQIQALLKVSLNLLTDNDARNEYLQYRNRCSRVADAADSRFALQQKILAAAADWGLAEKVWAEISARGVSTAEPAKAEPWFTTKLPARLQALFHASKSEALKSAVEQAVTTKVLSENSDVAVPTGLVAAENVASGDVSKAAAVLEGFARAHREDNDQRFQQETALKLVSQLVAAGKPDQAIAFTEAFKNAPQLREEMFQVIGAETTARGNALAAMVPARGEELAPPERIALLRGLVGALQTMKVK
ncbi:hypothetical protein GC176_15890 [bacterium]|nr:hypothetical protein [bacterium]